MSEVFGLNEGDDVEFLQKFFLEEIYRNWFHHVYT